MNKILLLVVATCAAGSVAYGSNEWGLHLAYWNADEADGSVGVGAKVAMEIIPVVQLEVRGTYFGDFETGGADLEVIPLEVGLALTLPYDKFDFYTGGGLGYYWTDSDAGGSGGDLGGYATAGIEVPVWSSGASYGETHAVLFGEFIYRFADAEDALVSSSGTLSDADLNGPGFNGGLLVRW